MVVDSNGDFKWNSNSDGSEASDSASEQSQNSSMNSKNAKRIIGFGSCCEPYISEAANKRLKQTPMDSYKKIQLAQTLLSLSPLGLNLGETPSFIDLTEVTVPEKIKTKRSPEVNLNAFQLMTEKERLKASNFNASFIRIGSWQRVAHNEGDLVAKYYYAKRKLVWEILDQGLKSKIEVQWHSPSATLDLLISHFRHIPMDLIGKNTEAMTRVKNQHGCRSKKHDNSRYTENSNPNVSPGPKPTALPASKSAAKSRKSTSKNANLLNQPPTFHRESDPQPRKHTMWNVASDFTNGQALIHRRHYAQFPPGALDKHYKKLIQCENRFLEMSQRPFPSQRSAYFLSDFHNGIAEFSFNFDRHGAEIPSNLQLPFSPCVQTRFDPTQQVQTYEQPKPTLRIEDSTSPISDEVIGSQAVQNPKMPVYWDQGITREMISFADFLGREQLPRLFSVAGAAQANPTISCQSFNVYNQGLGSPNLDSQLLSNFENQLMIDLQIEFSDKHLMPQANSLISFPEQVNYAVAADIKHPDYVQEMADNRNLVSAANDPLQPQPNSRVLPPPQPGSWVAARNSGIQITENNATSSFDCGRICNLQQLGQPLEMIHRDE
ncbi:hypothetical protein C1H46_022599 [Malus baccata]|uniref:TRF2/HOY1 PH-like domain-containing protein n=1 Tax=Malus baccata TaxID=106549 RepID=A0A540LZ31_MALBA|nr:hypothetical protein C1H46_022599 [Malus baccata]